MASQTIMTSAAIIVSLTYGKSNMANVIMANVIMTNVIMANVIMAKVIWQM